MRYPDLGAFILITFFQAEKNRAAAMANNLQKGSAGPMRLYVGSLHFNITEDMLRGIFEPFGRVKAHLLKSAAHTRLLYFAVHFHCYLIKHLYLTCLSFALSS